jgi:hypothetical protein
MRSVNNFLRRCRGANVSRLFRNDTGAARSYHFMTDAGPDPAMARGVIARFVPDWNKALVLLVDRG